MTHLGRLMALCAAAGASILSSTARADLFPDCYVRNAGAESPWVILEPIQISKSRTSDQLSLFIARSVESATSAARESLRNEKINVSLVTVDCGSRRKSSGRVDLGQPSINDFNQTNIKNFLALNIVTVAWGEMVSTPGGGVTMQFAVLPRLHALDDTPRTIVISRPPSTDPAAGQYLEEMRVVPIVGVLSRVDHVLSRLERGDSNFPLMDSKNRCQLITVQAALGWTETHGGAMLKSAANAWLVEWIQDLRSRHAVLAKATTNALCIL